MNENELEESSNENNDYSLGLPVNITAAANHPSIKTAVTSTFDARPVNTVDTFGVAPLIVAPEILVDPASAPITFVYSVFVPHGRTYVLRDFYFVPTRFLFNANNNPIQDLFTITFTVNDSPVSENSGLTFPSWGTGGYVDGFFIIPENSTVKMIVTITNPAYLVTGLPFPVFISASMQMRFNALLNNGAPPNIQIANIVDNDILPSPNLSGNMLNPTRKVTYRRP